MPDHGTRLFTKAEILALPESPGLGGYIRITVDAATGLSSYTREPVKWLLHDGDLLFYVLPDGSHWRTMLDGTTGEFFRERVGW